MRIIAGSAKGRRLAGPRGLGTRPPTGRMRESVFSSLADAVVGAAVIDLFAGSGSFGLEAMSRGADSVVFVERDRKALKALRANVEAVGLGGRIVAAEVFDALDRERGPLTLAFVDPPYDLADSEVERVLGRLDELMEAGGTVLVHRRRDHELPERAGTLAVTDQRRYGDAVVWWYRKEAN